MPPSRRCCARAACASTPGRATRSTSARPIRPRRESARSTRRSSPRRPARAVASADERRDDDASQAVAGVIDRNIAALIKRREEEKSATNREDRIADAISAFAGSMKFVYIHVAIYGAWIVVNLPFVPLPKFDPSYVVLAMVASVEAIFVSTFVMISQNRMARIADQR